MAADRLRRKTDCGRQVPINDHFLKNSFLSKKKLKDFSPAKTGFEMTRVINHLINNGKTIIGYP
jgi:hypothetical protein